jgi:hypothetical protein
MPYVHVYITSGGYGGTLLSIHNPVPIVATGLHECKMKFVPVLAILTMGLT